MIHFFTIQPNIPENKIPLKRQISNLLNYIRKKSGVSGNEVDSVEQFITPFLLDPNTIENLNEDDPIVYGHDVKNGRVFIGNGSDDTPTYFAFTTKRLMSVLRTLENDRAESRLPLVLHMDATFKPNDNEFPFMIIGISDNGQKFHPISMIVISHRTEEIYTRVLNDLKQACALILDGYDLRPDYVMIDAEDAEKNAAANAFGILPSRILMCYFHVQYNCKKRLKGHAKNVQAAVRRDIQYLRESLNRVEYSARCNQVLENWRNNRELNEFADYFESEWINGIFSQWAAFWTSPGIAGTNNCIESFNSLIKRNYTLRKRLDMYTFIKVAFRLIQDRSHDLIRQKPFCLKRSVPIAEQRRAQKDVNHSVRQIARNAPIFEVYNEQDQSRRKVDLIKELVIVAYIICWLIAPIFLKLHTIKAITNFHT